MFMTNVMKIKNFTMCFHESIYVKLYHVKLSMMQLLWYVGTNGNFKMEIGA